MVILEQRLKGNKIVRHVGIWKRAVQAKETADAKVLR